MKNRAAAPERKDATRPRFLLLGMSVLLVAVLGIVLLIAARSSRHGRQHLPKFLPRLKSPSAVSGAEMMMTHAEVESVLSRSPRYQYKPGHPHVAEYGADQLPMPAYVVAMYSSERHEAAKRSAAEHGLDLRFVWGVEGGSGEELNDGMVRHFLPEADARQYKEQHARYKAGNMTDKERADFLHGLKNQGAAFGHIRAVASVAFGKDDVAMILEDDFAVLTDRLIGRPLKNILIDRLNALPRAWGALYLGNEHCLTWAARGQPVGEGVTPLWTALCPVAYMLRRESAWRLLDSFLAKRSYCQSFDLQAAWTYEHGWNTFRSHPEGPFEAVEQDPYAVLLFGTDPFLFASASESIING